MTTVAHRSLFSFRWALMCIALLVLLPGCQRKVLFADDFTEVNEAWLVEADPLGQSLIAENRLYIQINQANTIQYATLEQPLIENFDLEVDATLLSGSSNSSYGVLFRMQDGNAFYRFDITGRGFFTIEKRNPDGTWTALNNGWQQSSSIRTGHNVTNRLKISANGQVVVFSVNDTVLQSYDVFDIFYRQGTVALSAGTFQQTGLSVAFDNLVITEP